MEGLMHDLMKDGMSVLEINKLLDRVGLTGMKDGVGQKCFFGRVAFLGQSAIQLFTLHVNSPRCN